MRKLYISGIVTIFILLSCVYTLVQAEDKYSAPKVEDEPFPWKSLGVVAICILGLGVSALKNSRRTRMEDA
jgi:hypothetical protein